MSKRRKTDTDNDDLHLEVTAASVLMNLPRSRESTPPLSAGDVSAAEAKRKKGSSIPGKNLATGTNSAAAAPAGTFIGTEMPSLDGGVQRRESDGGRFKAFHEERWDYMLAQLIEFRKSKGHCLVPHTYPPYPQLARWVKRQRRQYKLMNDGKTSTMTPERVKILEAEGFCWDSHLASWKEKVNDLKKYREEYGHTLVPSNYKANPHLATWVKCQRRQYKLFNEGKPSAMSTERIAELEGEGFVWEIRGSGLKPPAAAASSAPASSAAAAGALSTASKVPPSFAAPSGLPSGSVVPPLALSQPNNCKAPADTATAESSAARVSRNAGPISGSNEESDDEQPKAVASV